MLADLNEMNDIIKKCLDYALDGFVDGLNKYHKCAFSI